MGETDGMTEREKIMWGLLSEVICALSQDGSYYHLGSMLHNARCELFGVIEKENGNETNQQPADR